MDILNNTITALGRIDAGISGKLMNDSKIYNNIVDFQILKAMKTAEAFI